MHILFCSIYDPDDIFAGVDLDGAEVAQIWRPPPTRGLPDAPADAGEGAVVVINEQERRVDLHAPTRGSPRGDIQALSY
jgi:hypothetical protein